MFLDSVRDGDDNEKCCSESLCIGRKRTLADVNLVLLKINPIPAVYVEGLFCLTWHIWEECPCFPRQGGQIGPFLLSFQEELRSGLKIKWVFQIRIKASSRGCNSCYLPEGHVPQGKNCIVQSFTVALVSKGKQELVFSVSHFTVVLLNVNDSWWFGVRME